MHGQSLVSVDINYTVNFVLTGDYAFRIDKAFTLHLPGTGDLSMDPETPPWDALEPVKQLIGHKVTESVGDNKGVLRIVFDNGGSLRVEPDGQYEAWEAYGPNGSTVVCLPSGEYATWGAEN
jgi:hypothetical protein